MTGFIEGRDRGQATLFPARLDEALGEDHPIASSMLSSKLGCNNAPEATGWLSPRDDAQDLPLPRKQARHLRSIGKVGYRPLHVRD